MLSLPRCGAASPARILGLAALSALSFVAPTALLAAEQSSSELPLETVVVTAKGGQVGLTPVYAGGQVARGGRTGILGNLDFLDSPFSGTAYTADLVRSQQSESVGDVLANDPVVRVAKGFGNFQEVYIVRGFPVYSDDITINGVFGILPRQFVAAELLERVEVLRGANAFVNGAAPGGSGVGGSINLVPKRAPEGGVTRLSTGYESNGHVFLAADVGRRFGAGDAWGVRVNAVARDGETAVEDQERQLAVGSLGLDYLGERLRVSADLGYQDNRIDAPRPQVTPLGTAPGEPDSDANFAQPWTYTDERQLFGVLRAEYQFSDRISGWLGAGLRDGEEANVLANPNALPSGAMTTFRFDNTREDSVQSYDIGLSARFDTGPVGHRVVASASIVDSESRNAFAFSSFLDPLVTDLYRPIDQPAPAADFFRGGDLNAPLQTESVSTRSYALADTLDLLNEQLSITLGVRWQDIQTRSFDFNSGAPLSEYDNDKPTPMLGVVYRVSDKLSLYGNYAESLQPGQIAPAQSGGIPISNAGEVLEPFAGEQMEVGVKYDAVDFGLSAAVFRLNRPNAIVNNSVFSDSGEQQNQGVELSVFGEPVENLRLLGGFTWLDAELSRTEAGTNQGNAPIGVPELQGSLNVEWDPGFAPGLTLDGRWIYTGEQYIDAANTNEIDAWSRLDLGARYVFQGLQTPVTVRARLENVSDTAYWASSGGFPGANYLILGNPRTLLLSASINF